MFAIILQTVGQVRWELFFFIPEYIRRYWRTFYVNLNIMFTAKLWVMYLMGRLFYF